MSVQVNQGLCEGKAYTHIRLQSAAVDNLVVDSELAALVVDNKNPNAATAVVKRIGQTVEKTTLVKNRKTLLHITSLSHGNNTTVITDIQNTVLLENRAKHVLNDDIGRWVGNKRRFLVQLLGEEVNAEVAMLAGLSRGSDTNDLAGAALKDQEITNANVMAGYGDGVGGTGTPSGVAGGRVTGSRHGDLGVFDDYFLFTVVVVVMGSVNGVKDAVGSAVKSVAERVIVAVLVVISHVKPVLSLGLDGSAGLRTDPNFLLVGCSRG